MAVGLCAHRETSGASGATAAPLLCSFAVQWVQPRSQTLDEFCVPVQVRHIEVMSVNRQLAAGYMVLLSNLGYSAAGVHSQNCFATRSRSRIHVHRQTWWVLRGGTARERTWKWTFTFAPMPGAIIVRTPHRRGAELRHLDGGDARGSRSGRRQSHLPHPARDSSVPLVAAFHRHSLLATCAALHMHMFLRCGQCKRAHAQSVAQPRGLRDDNQATAACGAYGHDLDKKVLITET